MGGVLASTPMWGELARRIGHAIRDGAGERSDWGEPLFYAVLLAVPGALVGAAVGAVIAAARKRRASPTRD